MNTKKFIIASILVFIVFEILDFIIHGLILKGAYESLASVWRPDMNSLMWIMYVTALIFSFLFVYIFTKGYEGKSIAEGIRYGLLIGLLMLIVGMFNQYAVYPLPFILVLEWFIFGIIQYIIIGIVVAAVYKPSSK